ncbi:hypothetical protein ACP0G5_18380, partial [Escherichia coli]|uniref:hypothetical protein n=10 Tax=Enterobacteriaceae TaxID=543 RepID=UPI001A7E0CAD
GKGEALEIPHSPEKEPVSCLTDWHYSLALAFFFYLTAVDRHSRRIRQKAARTITSFFLNTFYRKLSSLLKPITPITPAKYL